MYENFNTKGPSLCVLATVLLHYDRRLGIPALVMAILVAFSRLYLYVHYPTDVLAGAVLGIGIGLLTTAFYDRVIKMEQQKSI